MYSSFHKIVFCIILINLYWNQCSYIQAQGFPKQVVHTYSLETNNKGFQHIYALQNKNDGCIALATDRGVYNFNGNKILASSNSTVSDFVNFFNDSNTIWALPYQGYIQALDSPNKKLFFFGNEPYQCLNAYKDNLHQIHFLLRFRNMYYEGILNKNKCKVSPLSNSFEFYVNFYGKNGISIDELNNQFRTNIKLPAIRLKFNNYLLIGNSCFEIINHHIVKTFDGNKFGFQESELVDKYFDEKGNCYLAFIGKKNGLYYWDHTSLTPIYTEADVNAITLDKYNQVYFTTLKNKLFLIKNQYISSYHFPHGIKNALACNSQIFIHSKKGNLETFNNKLIIDNAEKAGSFLYTEANKSYYIGANSVFDLQRNKIKPIKQLPSFFFTTVSKKAYLNIPNYSLRIDKNMIIFKLKNSYQQLELESPYNICTSFQTQQNEIELGTTRGIYIALMDSTRKIEKVITKTVLDENKILLCSEGNAALYYFCDKGIVKHDLLKHTYELVFELNTSHPFYDINALFYYNNYLIGINQFGYTSYHLLTKRFNEYQFLQPNTNESLVGGFECDSSLYFFSGENLYKVPKSFLVKITPTPTISFNAFETTMQPIIEKNSDNQYAFAAKNNSTISFNVLNLSQNETNAWTYSLMSDDENLYSISQIDNHLISLKNLPYGSFKLSVFFKQQLVETFAFELTPKFYQTDIFKLFVILCLLGFLLLGIYFELHYRNTQKIMALENNHKVFILENSAKLNQLKPHFIFNALMPLQKYIVRHDDTKALNFLKDFSVLLRQMLNMSRLEYSTLSEEFSFITNYIKIKLEEMTYSFDFTLDTDIDEQNQQIIKIPSLYLQPLLENALLYGIPTTKLGVKPFIHLFVQIRNDSLIEFNITDSGQGFDLEKELSYKKNNALYILYERIQVLQKLQPNQGIFLKSYKNDRSFSIQLTLPILIKT